MDDIAEQQDISKEIVDAISTPIGFGHDIDESELLAELEMLQEEDVKANFLNIGPSKTLELPSVPTHKIGETSKGKPQKGLGDVYSYRWVFLIDFFQFISVKSSEDKDLEALKNWAS